MTRPGGGWTGAGMSHFRSVGAKTTVAAGMQRTCGADGGPEGHAEAGMARSDAGLPRSGRPDQDFHTR